METISHATCRRRYLLSLILFALFFFICFDLQDLHHPPFRLEQDVLQSFDGPANSTLGFGSIVAVSRDGSTRREGLLSAGNLTGLEISVPKQPIWTDADIESVKCKNQSRILRASALAWLGHLNALQWFLHNTTHSTALILEDDIDWDIHLRTHQISLISYALRELLNFTSHAGTPTTQLARTHRAKAQSAHEKQTYWARLSQWDILHLGHCGDIFNASQMATMTYARFTDVSLPQQDHLHPQTASQFRDLRIQNQERLLHPSKRPLCSFGYAVTRTSAERILRELSGEEENHGTWAYDVRLMEACRDLGWRCYSANPEVFHHVDGIGSDIQRANGGTPLFKDGEGPDSEPWKKFQRPKALDNRDEDKTRLVNQEGDKIKKGWEEGKVNGPHTPNIACSARAHADAVRADGRLVDVVRDMAKRPGECMVNQDKQDMRKNPSRPFVF